MSVAVGFIKTPVDLIALALKTAGVIGVGQTPDASDTFDVFIMLNAMISQWNRQRWLIYTLEDFAVKSTGELSYTVGIGGQFNVPRTDQIETAYCRMLNGSPNNPFDFPLNQIHSREDYSAITLKSMTSFPHSYYFDSDYPMGQLFVWPVPAANQFEIHIVIKDWIQQFPSLTTPIDLPPEYQEALLWNLSVRIRPMFQLPPDPSIVALAKASLNVIRQANAQVPTLRLPAEILNAKSGHDVTLGNLNGLPWAF